MNIFEDSDKDFLTVGCIQCIRGELLEGLREVLTLALAGRFSSTGDNRSDRLGRWKGICYYLTAVMKKNNVDQHTEFGIEYEAVNTLSRGWIHHTGDPSYPVPRLQPHLWEGEQLELRLDLINYMINRLHTPPYSI